MVKSKGWEWKEVEDSKTDQIWKEPSVESYYLVNRWKTQNKKNFLDLGCGLGRHSILFGKNDFNVSCFDISEYAINKTKEWAESLNLMFNYKVGDMLKLPYEDQSFDCIYCKHVISHTDTIGVKKIINEIKRVLKDNGECYLTLCSKLTLEGKGKNWPVVDDNTRLKMEEGPEYLVPHFYADYKTIIDLFIDFQIVELNQIEEFFPKDGKINKSYHYQLLIKLNHNKKLNFV